MFKSHRKTIKQIQFYKKMQKKNIIYKNIKDIIILKRSHKKILKKLKITLRTVKVHSNQKEQLQSE
jgi:hypothetical protein